MRKLVNGTYVEVAAEAPAVKKSEAAAVKTPAVPAQKEPKKNKKK